MNHNQSSKPSVKDLNVLKLLNDLVFTPFLILLVKFNFPASKKSFIFFSSNGPDISVLPLVSISI